MDAIVSGKVEIGEKFVAKAIYELTSNITIFEIPSGSNAIKITSNFFPEFSTIVIFDLSKIRADKTYLTLGSAYIATSNLYSSTWVYVPLTYYKSDGKLHINPSLNGRTVESNTYISRIEIGTLE